MALNNLAGLKDAALAWIERTGDLAASTIIDDCVTLCEARINKTPSLRVSQMETQVDLTLVDGGAQLPGDFLAMHRVTTNDSVARLLTYAEPGWYKQAHPFSGTEAGVNFYSLIGSTIRCKSSATLSIIYYAKVPSLTTVNPNWLLTKAPDVYLNGTILELLIALEGDGQEKYAGLFGAGIESLVQSETFSRGGVLTMRASMPTP